MSWHFLQEQEEASWAGSYLAGAPSALLRLIPTPGVFFSHGREMGFSRPSRFGTMFARSTASRGEGASMSSAEAFPAKTSAPPTALAPESTVSEADCGLSSPESFAKFDRDSRSWRTAQLSLFGGLAVFSEIWPEWGIMRGGECSRLAPLVLHTHAPECSFWPTPRASDRDNCGGSNARQKAQRNGTYVGRAQNPQLSEWLMGWPIDWTALRPLETDKFQVWLASHGQPSPQNMEQSLNRP